MPPSPTDFTASQKLSRVGKAAGLGERDPVQRRVQLSVPGSGESVPGLFGNHTGSGEAIMACVGVLERNHVTRRSLPGSSPRSSARSRLSPAAPSQWLAAGG